MINDIVLEARPGGISRPNLYCLVRGTYVALALKVQALSFTAALTIFWHHTQHNKVIIVVIVN